ncbi:MAG TPA: PHP domain-containing protein [Gammaproteobacteria bacterium]
MHRVDLHSHSHCSDGTLSPAELVARAASHGVTRLALTDHDTVAGLAEAGAAAAKAGLALVPGVELSLAWSGVPVHLVGLGIDPAHPALAAALGRLAALREERAERIAHSLARAGIDGALAGARSHARGAQLGRTHFARFLARRLHYGKLGDVYRRYLVGSRPGHVHVDWPALEEGIGWVREAGGVAVLAHPARYRLTAGKLRRLLAAGCEAGLGGLEVAGARSLPAEVQLLSTLARQFGLAASAGSDFHSHEQRWIELGRLVAWPDDLPFVLDALPAAA